MPRYIDADALKQGVGSYSPVKYTYEYGLVITVEDIDSAPTADVVERKRGKWIWMGDKGDSRFMCSVCKWKEKVPTCMGVPNIWEYCPSCGAYMREESDNGRFD